MDMELFRTEKKMCSCCMEEHEVKSVRIMEHTSFKNVPVDYTAEYFYCDMAEELYADEIMISQNNMRMKEVYRRVVGLLTAKQISDIRVKYGISQRDLCTLLGWGGKTITRYEGHQIQDKAHDSILKKLEQDPEWFLRLLYESKDSLSIEAFTKYRDIAIGLYEDDQDRYLRKSIEAKYIRYQENALYNGNVGLCLDKVVDVIRYFSNSTAVINLYKVKLMKLMWYADFLSYKLRGQAITGLVYQALPMGAVPIGHDSIIDLKGIVYEEIDMGDGTAYRFEKSENKEYSFLDEDEKNVLDVIIAKLGNMSKDEIVQFMHKEQAYKETPHREIISYKYADSLLI